jgi:RND family efflux transporter MFP subunit
MAPWVRHDQPVDVSVEAYPERVFQGKVWRISPTVDQAKRTFLIEALIQNPAGDLKPGSFARARLKTNKTEQISLVPVRAVNYVLGSNKVYLVRGDKIEAREVKVGDRFDQDVEILEGARDGDLIATTQLARLDTGTKVRVASK